MDHKPVLLQESIEGLEMKPGNVFLDGTIGLGGHSEYVCKTYGKDIKIIGLDVDEDSIAKAKDRLKKLDCKAQLYKANFRNIDQVLRKLKIDKINAILLDLGMSSAQLEKSGRGFSFQRDEPLLMAMEKDSDSSNFTAKDIVNTWSEQSIADILYGYGEERFAKRIARRIVEQRSKHPIETTFDLVKIIKESVPAFYRRRKIHYATQTFQALRIAVNDELGALDEVLKKGFEHLERTGRMAIISFHSLEDRIVKRFFKGKKGEGVAKLITKKPIIPTKEEIRDNPRARSAKLRILEKI